MLAIQEENPVDDEQQTHRATPTKRRGNDEFHLAHSAREKLRVFPLSSIQMLVHVRTS